MVGVALTETTTCGDVQRRDWALLIFLCALPIGIAGRILPEWNLPLWLDETFTGTIAAQPSFSGLLRWCLSELTGPAFYMPMWVWAKIAGVSNVALRAPGLIFSIATPLLIARYGHPNREIRLLWAALTLLWLPVLSTASEARPYPQLLFLGTVQVILFLKLARNADAKISLLWGTVTALAVLTHSYALVIGGLQGLALLNGHRRAILKMVPALIPLSVMALWMAYHLPFILGFTAGHVAHYAPVQPVMLFAIPKMVLGEGIGGFIVFGLLFLTRDQWKGAIRLSSPEAQLIWAGVIAAAIIIAVGLIGATMMPRYLTPGVPALLFGLACWADRVQCSEPWHANLAFLALFAGMVANLAIGPFESRFRERRYFQFETASTWLMARHPDRLHFLWSTPTGAQSGTDNLAEVAGFFFRRHRQPLQVVVERAGPDPSATLVAAATNDPHSAILWISDDPLTPAMRPKIERLDPRWECRDFGGEEILIYACRRP